MIVKANPAGILGTGHCVPDQVWTNKDLEKMMDTSDEWIRSRTGIGARHVAPEGVTTSDLATKAAEEALGKAHITVNKNAIPNDPEKPFVTSGIRIGTAAMTTRGFDEADARALANLVADVLENPADEATLARTAEAATALCTKNPVYGA